MKRREILKETARGRSSVWLERLPVTQKVAGSSPVGPARWRFFIRETKTFLL